MDILIIIIIIIIIIILGIRSNTLINNQEMALSAKTKALISKRTDFIQIVKKE